MTTSRRLLGPYVRQSWRAVAGAGAATIVLTLADLAQPWPLKLVIDRLLRDSPGGFALHTGDIRFLAAVAGLVLAIAAASAVTAYYAELWLNRAGERILHDLRVAVYEHLQRLSLAFHDRRKKGDLVTRVTGDVNAVGALFSDSLGELVSAVLLLVGMAAVSFYLDPLLALVSLATTPLLALVTFRYRRTVKELARRQRAEEGEIASLAAEALSAMQVVKAFGSERFEHGRVRRRSEVRRGLGVEVTRKQARFAGIVDMLGALAVVNVLVVGVFRVSAGVLSPGDLVVFVAYASKTYRPLKTLARETAKIAAAMARADRVAEILAADLELVERPGAYTGSRAAGEVEFDRVSFAYGAERPVFHDLSLAIAAGSRLAVVGPSGAGKSTLAALLARFYDPTTGRVLLDGRDVRDCSLAWLRDQVGFLLQDTVLFSGTVADNVAYATDASREQVVAAAKAAGADAFIAELPEGYDMELGPSGIGLSGGQRQRIGIARVLLRDPPVLVLDEPTAGLDATSEALLLDGLERLMRGRTTILITHSIPLACRADRVLVVDGGRVIEDGEPEALLARPGLFRRLASHQGVLAGEGRLAAVER